MSTRNERFADGMHSLERMIADCDPGKSPILSDGGIAAEKVYRRLDISLEEEAEAEEALLRRRAERLKEARNRLILLHLERLIPVLEAIVKNGMDHDSIIEDLAITWRKKKARARRLYFELRKELMEAISAGLF